MSSSKDEGSGSGCSRKHQWGSSAGGGHGVLRGETLEEARCVRATWCICCVFCIINTYTTCLEYTSQTVCVCAHTGADLSDYFNYGFNEDTWKAYCEKQKKLRMGLEVSTVGSVTSKITVRQTTRISFTFISPFLPFSFYSLLIFFQ